MMTVKDYEAKQVAFIMLKEKEKISFRNDNIVVTSVDGQIKYQVTCYKIFALFVIGHFTLTSGLIQRSHKFGFPIYLMTNSMKLYESFGGRMEGNVLLHKHQYAYKGIDIGKHILRNKLYCQRTVLNKLRNKSTEQKEAVRKLDEYIDAVKRYNGDLEGMLGYEGSAARIYFKNYFDTLDWRGRKPRIKPDFVNSTLDIGYTVLFNIIDAMLRIYGFDTYCGVLHRQFYMRKSLVCDIMEPFRPLIDAQVRKAVNLQQCKEEDFQVINGQYLLKWKLNGQYIKFLMEGILAHKREIFLYVQQFYRSMMKGKRPEEYPVFKLELS
mgnify:FL=1